MFRLPEPRPDHKMLWSAVPGRPGFGLYFHQVIEKEGVAVRRLVYILAIIGSRAGRLARSFSAGGGRFVRGAALAPALGGAGGCGFEVYGAWEVGAEGGDISSKLGVAGFHVLL